MGSREVIKDYTPTTIKATADWSWLAGKDVGINEPGQGEDAVNIRWTLTRGGAPCFLADGEMFGLSLQDSTTGLTSFTGMVQGLVYPNQ